jgi:hypothetical protein
MTTQVVLTNGLGIALASDSAVTAGGKVLVTSEKIFELPKPHKVAVLTSGRAQFMGIPWEVIFSAWTESIDKQLGSMDEYRESLYKFLRSTIPTGGQLTQPEAEYIRSSYFGGKNCFDLVTQAMNDVLVPFYRQILAPDDLEAFLSNDAWDPDFKERMTALLTPEVIEELDAALEQVADDRRNYYVAAGEVSEAQALVWIDKYWDQIEGTPSEFDFKTWPTIPNFDLKVKKLASVFVVHADYAGESNINFFGYGAGDLFPSGSGVFMHGCVRGTLIKRFEGSAESSGGPRHYFFGQDEAIKALTLGEDELLTSTAVEKSKQTLNDIYDRLSDVEDERAKLARDYVKESLEVSDLAGEMNRAGSEERRKPFQKAIGMSPILDLAEFAAQLVGVQAAYAAMTQENPSVGGFVDVAVITHRRGFEWIRTKHQ